MSNSPTRERILTVTRKLLSKKGAGGVTIGQVAAAAHISRATLYRYFGDKATLLRAAGVPNGMPGEHATPRERILEALLEVVGERGIHGATLDEIASRAGLSRSGLQWHYRNKEEMVADLARYIPLLPAVEEQVAHAGDSDADIERQLVAFTGVLLENADRLRGVGRFLLFESSIYPEVAQLASTYSIGRALPLLTSIFEQHEQAGRLRPGSAQVRAQAMMGMFMSLILLKPALGHLLAPDDQATAREFINILLHGILPGTEREQA